ncbi:MAG: GNAT family N-acetyltransferase [Candidatus Pacearchaeota archaeon]
MKEFQIKKVEKKDLGRVQEIIYSCIDIAKKLNEKEKEFLKKKYSLKNLEKYSKNSDFFVVLYKKNIIASGRLTKKNEIATIYVDPNLHGRGAGSTIVNFLVNFAKKKKRNFVFVRSLLQSTGFYERLGFSRKKLLFKPVMALRMERKFY